MRPLERPATHRSFVEAKAKRFRKLRRLQAWGLWARGCRLEFIGRAVGSVEDQARPVCKQQARHLVCGGRRWIVVHLGAEFADAVTARRHDAGFLYMERSLPPLSEEDLERGRRLYEFPRPHRP